jgi:endonuclease YncB( thermonuclease family)
LNSGSLTLPHKENEHADDFTALQKEAEKKKKGMWGE